MNGAEIIIVSACAFLAVTGIGTLTLYFVARPNRRKLQQLGLALIEDPEIPEDDKLHIKVTLGLMHDPYPMWLMVRRLPVSVLALLRSGPEELAATPRLHPRLNEYARMLLISWQVANPPAGVVYALELGAIWLLTQYLRLWCVLRGARDSRVPDIDFTPALSLWPFAVPRRRSARSH